MDGVNRATAMDIEVNQLNNHEFASHNNLTLTNHDLHNIVQLSGFDPEPALSDRAKPYQVVTYEDSSYKVRAYQSEEAAQQWFDMISVVPDLFAPCYGRSGRFLVFQYVSGNQARNLDSDTAVYEIAAFLADLASVEAPYTLESDFEGICRDVEAAGIFKPNTMQLVRRYFAQAVSTLPVEWGLEYYDPLPRNFVVSDDGRLISIDEKHLRVGPRSVSLIKLMEQWPETSFENLKDVYFSKIGFVPFEFPKYHEFLLFYRCLSALAMIGAHRAREVNMQEPRFHDNRHIVLRIVRAKPHVRLSEEPPWVAYRRYPVWRFAKRGFKAVRRRVTRTTISTMPTLSDHP